MVSNWSQVSVCDLIEAGVVFVGDGYRAKNEEFAPTGLPFARIANIPSDGVLDLIGADLFPENDLFRVGNKISQPGDIVFTSKGSVGRFVFVRDDMPRFVYSPQLSFWRFLDHEAVCPRFIYFWMRGNEFTEQVDGLKSQTDMADYVSLGDQRRMRITLPPLPVQRRIAEILGRLDDKIEVNRRINRTLAAMAQALYRHWFVEFGPFRDREFVESELGLVPKGWEVARLGDVARTNELSIRNGHEPNRITYVDISSVSAGAINSFAPMAFVDAPSRARRLVKHGDTIWSAVRPNRRSFCLIQHPPEDLVVSTGFVVLSPAKAPYSFLYCLLARQDFTGYLDAQATGAAYPAVRPDDFEAELLVLPNHQAITDFHRHVEPWLEQRYVLEQEIRQLAEARDYLLPKLLSGEVEVA